MREKILPKEHFGLSHGVTVIDSLSTGPVHGVTVIAQMRKRAGSRQDKRLWLPFVFYIKHDCLLYN
jgi:hypothetical protein